MKLVLLVLLAVCLSSDARRITWESDAACQAELPALAGAEARAPAVPQPRPGCFFKTDFRCEKEDKCGQEVCPYPKACAKVKKVVEKQIVVEDPLCKEPKLVCKEIKKPCGPVKDGLFCKYDETCISEKICKKVQCGYYTKNICKDEYKCEKIDPQVCRTEEHQVCIARDPKSFDPGYFSGYAMGWAPDWKQGQICGHDICKPGSFCATCEVELCLDKVVEKSAAQCGFDPVKQVPAFCPEGHMCVELCKKTVQDVIEVPVCADPFDPLYTKYFEYAECGEQKCGPGYKCKKEKKEVCPAAASGSGTADPYGYGFPYTGYPSAGAGAGAGNYVEPYYGSQYPVYSSAGAGAGEGKFVDSYYGYPAAGSGSGQGAGYGFPYPGQSSAGSGAGSGYGYPYSVYPSSGSGAGEGKFVDPYYGYGATDSGAGEGAGYGYPHPYYPSAGSGVGEGAGYGYSYPDYLSAGSGAGEGAGYGYSYPDYPSAGSGAGEGNFVDPYYGKPAAGSGSGQGAGYGFPYPGQTSAGSGAGEGSGYGYPYSVYPSSGSGAAEGSGYGLPSYGYPSTGSGSGSGSNDPQEYIVYAPGGTKGRKGGKATAESTATAKGEPKPASIPIVTPVEVNPIFEPVVKPDETQDPYHIPGVKPAEESGKKSSASSFSTATVTDELVTVWGSSKTSGDGKADFKASADTFTEEGSPALHADIVGGSGPGEDGEGDAQVHCNTSADGGKAKCNGEANHDA